MRPRLLDLFCGAGGAALGYHRAGFDVVGVDIRPQPHYPFEFVHGDALSYLDDGPMGEDFRWTERFDAIHASPPCQTHTAMRQMWNAREHDDLIGATRELLDATGLPYIIENVPGAPLNNAVTVCGASLGLSNATHDLARHRLFEANFPLMVPPCAHGSRPVLGIYGDHARDRRRVPGENPERGMQLGAADGLEKARALMEMPWANWRELSQAIPPAYTELIGQQLIQHLEAVVIARAAQSLPHAEVFNGSSVCWCGEDHPFSPCYICGKHVPQEDGWHGEDDGVRRHWCPEHQPIWSRAANNQEPSA